MAEMEHVSLFPLDPWEYRGGRWEIASRFIPVEHPITVYVNGTEVATLMASPHEPLALGLGFVANEGWIESMDDVEIARVCGTGDCVDLWLRRPVPGPVRRVFTSGCTGGQTLDLPSHIELPPLPDGAPVSPQSLFDWLRELQQRSPLYQQGRGIHGAGLVKDGSLQLVAEDIGRHNALDRLRGLALLKGVDTRGGILLTTGRISAEMALKAARMGCPIVASRTTATSLAVQLARRWNLTLVAYLRGNRFWVYTGVHRIQGHEALWGREP